MDVVGLKKSQIFFYAFWILLFVNLVSMSTEARELEIASKALLMPSLALYLWSSVSRRGLRWARFLLIGLGLAFIGDVTLSFSDGGTNNFFLIGMASFLAMHIFFIKHYLRMRDLNDLSTLPNLPIMFLIFAVAVVLIDVITSAAPQSLFLPLIAFGMTLAASTGMSAQAFDKLSDPRAYTLVFGALLVMASDIILGLGLTPRYRFYGQSEIVMLTYGAGMFLIVRATLATMRRRKKKSGQVSDPTGNFEEDLGDFEISNSENQAQTS